MPRARSIRMDAPEIVARPRVSPAHLSFPGEPVESAERRARERSVLMAKAAIWGYRRMPAEHADLTVLDDGTVTGPPADHVVHSLLPAAAMGVPLLTTSDTQSLPGSPIGDPGNPDVVEVCFISHPGDTGFRVLFATHKAGGQVMGHMWTPDAPQQTGGSEWPATDIESKGAVAPTTVRGRSHGRTPGASQQAHGGTPCRESRRSAPPRTGPKPSRNRESGIAPAASRACLYAGSRRCLRLARLRQAFRPKRRTFPRPAGSSIRCLLGMPRRHLLTLPCVTRFFR